MFIIISIVKLLERYVFHLNGDTPHGYINYKEWSHDSENVDCKILLRGKVPVVGPIDVESFVMMGNVSYHGYDVNGVKHRQDIVKEFRDRYCSSD